MSPIQEAKVEKMYDLLLEMNGDMKAHKIIHGQFRESILDLAKEQFKQEVKIELLTAEKDKAKGGMWVIGLIGGSGLITALIEIFSKR